MSETTIQDYLGKKIKVTYTSFEGEDFYDVIQLNDDDDVVIERSSQTLPPFSVDQKWFLKKDTGRKIEILN
jgi:hypothetical protein